MDCRTFRDNHLAFLDDALADTALVAMQRHLNECAACSKHDTAVRRSLLVFRNLPAIEPSADFQARLNARLYEARRTARSAPTYRGPGLSAFAATAAGVMAAGYLVVAAFDWNARPNDLALPPVVATRPATPPAADPSQALVASVSSGMPLWPTALVAEQAPVHFINSQFQLAGWAR
jgi:anti-sigma factor RsiW